MAGFPPAREYLWAVLSARSASVEVAIGILVLDRSADRLYFRVNRNWRAENVDSQLWWDEFIQELSADCSDSGGLSLFEFLQDSASHFLTVSDARTVLCSDISSLLDVLYETHVHE